MDEKRALRRKMADRRATLQAEVRLRASALLAERLEVLLVSARVVASFVPIRCEIDPGPALAAHRARGGTVLLPRVRNERRPRLAFHVHEAGDRLAPGAFGVPEPLPTSPEAPPESIDVLVMPGLAFDMRGGRLGYGGGYYDELASQLRDAGRGVLVGVAYDVQLVDLCPVEPGDVAVDHVVTEERLVRCRTAVATEGHS